MDSILEMVLTAWIDPVIWFKSMSVLGYKRGKRKCIAFAIVYYLLIIAKSLSETNIESKTMNTMVGIALTIYIFIVTIVWFDGDLVEKIIVISLFHCILVTSELVVIHVFFSCMNGNWDLIMNNNLVNASATIIAKSLQAVLFYWLFGKKRYKNLIFFNQNITLSLIAITIMVNNMVAINISMEKDGNVILLFEVIQCLVLCYILIISMTLKRKEQWISDLNQEVYNNLERKKLLQELEHFKHDYASHGAMMLQLLEHQEYDKLKEYMKDLFKGVEQAEVFYDHPNVIVAILMSELIQKAKKVQVLFTAKIQVDEFGMSDEEVCSVLNNLVVNGIEAAAKVPSNMARVSLQVLYTKSGYEMRCVNPCIGTADFKKTSKKDKKSHGFGGAIVDKITKKYRGIVERSYRKMTEDGIGMVTVSVYIPLVHKKTLY